MVASLDKESRWRESMRFMALRKNLKALKERQAFGVGAIVTTLDWPYAHTGMKVVGEAGDTITLAPNSNKPEETVVISRSQLYRFEEYREAFEQALMEYPYTMEELFPASQLRDYD